MDDSEWAPRRWGRRRARRLEEEALASFRYVPSVGQRIRYDGEAVFDCIIMTGDEGTVTKVDLRQGGVYAIWDRSPTVAEGVYIADTSPVT